MEILDIMEEPKKIQEQKIGHRLKKEWVDLNGESFDLNSSFSVYNLLQHIYLFFLITN